MATIDELFPEQIRYPEIYQKIKDLGDSFVRCVQAKETYFLQEKLEILLNASNLQNFNPDLYKNYQDFLIALKWTAFPLLPEEKALLLLKNNYLSILDSEDTDVQDRMEARMFTLDLFPRNELRQKMQKALKENKERLGNKTFGEWLLDYDKTFDFRERDELTHLQYVRQNPTVQDLSEPEKNKLRKALQFFDANLLVTPVMSEPLLSMAIRAMIKGGIIKEPINPALLQPFPFVEVTPKKEEKSKIAPPLPSQIKKEVMPTPLDLEEKPKKPGVFEKLFGKPAPPKPEIAKEEKPVPPPYEKKISPYEVKREIPQKSKLVSILTKPIITIDVPRPEPPRAEEIQTFSEMTKSEMAKIEPERKKPPLPPHQYQIRTMKGDIEKVKKQPIPPKPEPKIKDNIVDLSGK